jgi:hypothetical protein
VRSILHVLVVIIVVIAGGCSRDPKSSTVGPPQPTHAITLAPSTVPSATVFPSATASAPETPSIVETVAEKQLRTARFSAMTIVSWSRPGIYVATLDHPPSEASMQVTLALALDQHPIGHRRPLAFARLARALGMHVVPPTVVRRISTGELGAIFENDAEAKAYLSAHAAVQNDGTIDALLMAPSRSDDAAAWNAKTHRPIVLDEAPEALAWARAVASVEPVPGENTTLLRDYVEALVLDYLSCNIMRRSLVLDDAQNELLAIENDGAFPLKNFANAEARLLERLKPVVRFPRSLLDALTLFDRIRARDVFMPGTFDTWLVSPRTLMLVDERRLALLSLIAARVEEYGEPMVLSL